MAVSKKIQPTHSVSFQGQAYESLPTLVVHADWSIHPKKRWVAIARLDQEGRYQTLTLRPVGALDSFFSDLRALAGPSASILAGFDFPFGVPLRYAEQAGITCFVEALRGFGKGDWSAFYDVATQPHEISLHRPFFPKGAGKKGEFSRQQLIDGLGVETYEDLLRHCDRATPTRRAANAIFWTLGGAQVGKAAITGWRDLVAPALCTGEEIAMWPFDGGLAELLQPGALVLAETYPAEFYHHLGLTFPKSKAGQKSGKRVQSDRQANAQVLLDWAATAGVQIHEDLVAQCLNGFGPSPDGEDPFDASVGLLGLLNLLLGERDALEPGDALVRAVEGWILGQDYGAS